MRICMVILTAALLAAWGGITPAAAQECDPDVCANPWNQAKAKGKKKPAMTKPAKKPAKDRYLRY